jgi:hypothetical protein
MSDLAPGLDFLVRRSDWKEHRFAESPAPSLQPGQVLFRVDRFAFTANNVTYALAGDLLGYWRFFPAAEGWGRLPVMGFADVVRSAHPDVAAGTRCFGFYPMSRYLVIEPDSVSAAQIVDGAAHRRGLAPTYSQYGLVARDRLYDAEHEDVLMLLRGLFTTSFLADDFLAGQDHFGAGSVLISSASSKTSIALGWVTARGGRARTVGLTSARNRDFVRSLGCYDEVVTYDEIAGLDRVGAALFVDMAGSAPLRRAVHEHFGDRLHHSCSIGVTHWEATGDSEASLPGPKPEFFFAPAQIQKRVADWGAAGLQERLAAAWSAFRVFTEDWLVVRRGYGPEAVREVYLDTLAGRTPPQQGQVLSLWDAPRATNAPR